jgi:hypothetical protein
MKRNSPAFAMAGARPSIRSWSDFGEFPFTEVALAFCFAHILIRKPHTLFGNMR